ncbi:hypothetical protein AC1031_009294 [Aphanomyces cochlioides]|nr:hypothetical protein AC1031_009294 [Aphanomyces cochlioides]
MSDDELYIPTYQVAQPVLSLLDSDSEDEDRRNEVTPIKRRKVVVPPSANDIVVVPDEEDDKDHPVFVLESSDDEEDGGNDVAIRKQLEQDPVLRRTQELLRKVQKPLKPTGPVSTVISIESDEDKSYDAPSSSDSATSMTVRIRWKSSSQVSEFENFKINKTDAFKVILDEFTAKWHVPSSAVRMVFDGAPLSPFDTPEEAEVEDDDIVDFIVDWSQVQVSKPAANAIRVRVRRSGSKKREVFTIAPEMKMEKLLTSFCSVHHLQPESVVLKLFGDEIDLTRTVESYMLEETDVIDAETTQVVSDNDDSQDSKSTVAISLRFSPKDVETYRIDLESKVETLVAKVCAKRNLQPTQIKLKIDGEAMHPQQPFSTYDLEGEELIDVTTAT